MKRLLLGCSVVVLLFSGGIGLRKAVDRHLFVWLPAYVARVAAGRPAPPAGPVHVLVMTVDHWEPRVYWPPPEQERARVERWVRDYPALADKHRDADGRVPQHTWAYPHDQFEGWQLAALSGLAFGGYGEVELHLHHAADTAASLRDKLDAALTDFGRYGALQTFEDVPQRRFGFVHGNWTLDNSSADPHCGVNNELDVLRDMGCYADFTFPAAGTGAQPRQINSVYYAVDTPAPKSYDTGTPVTVGRGPPANALMLVQGVLALDWQWRRPWRLRVETSGRFYRTNPPSPHRADLWVDAGVHVAGRPEWVIVKTHSHGAEESQMEMWFDGPFDELYTYLESRYNDGAAYVLHYVTAREMYNIIKAAEAGETGNPHAYRDYVIPPYANTRVQSNVPYTLRSGGETIDIAFSAADYVTCGLRAGNVTQLEGALAEARLGPADGQILLTDANAPLRITARYPLRSMEGGTYGEPRVVGGRWAYVVTPTVADDAAAGAELRVRWTYAKAGGG